MNEILTEDDRRNYEEANFILSYIFTVFNIFIIIIFLFLFSSYSKLIRYLKLKLNGIILFDSISLISHSLFDNEESFIYELLFSTLYSIEFYFYISFIYQIFNNTDSKLSKGVELISPFQICIYCLLIIFSYHKFSFFYREIINVIQYILVLSSLILLYKYLNNTIKLISSSLKPNDIQYKQIYAQLKILNDTSIFLILFYNIIKIFIIFIHNEYYILYLEIGLNTINFGIKYFIFLLLAVIIYNLKNNIYKVNYDETIGINQK